MRLPILLRISYPLLQDPLSLLYELTMQINGIVRDSAWSIILPEDEVRGLLVVLVHFGGMLLACFRELVSGSSITTLIRLMRLSRVVSSDSPRY